jgi:conserved oligomeric Golgi complex subunit 2
LVGAERGIAGSMNDHESQIPTAAILERTATRALYLSECQRVAQSVVVNASANTNDVPQQYEYERFVVRLGPRIRKLEQETVLQLGRRWEDWLIRYTKQQQASEESQETSPITTSSTEKEEGEEAEESYFTDLGHIVRGLVLLGRAKEVETIFTNTAIRPLLQSHLSLGRMDHGGARGECAGLGTVLQELLQDIQRLYRPIWMRLQSANEDLFEDEIDLITHSVWVPLVAALMKDTALRMAIFAPGLAPVWHANYTTLVDGVMATLAPRLLLQESEDDTGVMSVTAAVQRVQDRMDQHPMTAEFMKRWNLPIYYQLRFGECGTRIQRALEATQLTCWSHVNDDGANLDNEVVYAALRERTGLQYPLFLELYDTILSLWRPDIWVRPLTHRFLRGAVQLLGRVVAFCQEGMDGKLLFGPPPPEAPPDSSAAETEDSTPPESNDTSQQYCWGDRENEVAAVVWELDRLETVLLQDYTQVICDTLQSPTTQHRPEESEDLKGLIQEVFQEASELIVPVIDHGWNDRIIPTLIAKCAGPLGAVKGVAATYRMTNRPPPTLSSPFVATILRPVRELAETAQIPARISWKAPIVATIAQRYAAAVADLLGTVQRAEESLSKRKGRATRPSGAMSDADKVKLQLYLDYQAFVESVRELGDVDLSALDGITQLGELTREGAALYQAPAAKSS